MFQPSGILTKEEIRGIILTEDPNEKCCAVTSYDFRLGDEYIIPHDGEEIKIRKCSETNGVLRVPPFTSVIISSYEKVKLPNNVTGRFDLRLEWALKGFVLQVGTQIEPGYEGILIGLLHNFSDVEMLLPCAAITCRIFTAEFCYTSKKVNAPEKVLNDMGLFVDRYKNTISGSLKNYVDNIQKQSDKFTNESERKLALIEKLKEKVELTKEKVDTSFNFWRVGLLTLCLSIGVPTITTLLVTKFTFDRDDTPYEKIHVLENKLDSLSLRTSETLKRDSVRYFAKNQSGKH